MAQFTDDQMRLLLHQMSQDAAATAQTVVNAVAARARSPRRPAPEKRLPSFTSGQSSDWLAWKNVYNNVAKLKAWTDEEKKDQLVAAMEGRAGRMVHFIDVTGKTAAQILTLYDAKFLPPLAGDDAKHLFKRCTQDPDEDIVMWHARVTEVFMRAYPNANYDTDDRLVEQFIMGLFNNVVLDRTNQAKPTTMTEALDVATAKEAGLKQLKRAAYMKKTLRTDAHLLELHGTEPEGELAALTGSECFHCKGLGHFRNECPLLGFSREAAQNRTRAGSRQRGRGRGRGRGTSRGRGGRGGRGRGGSNRGRGASRRRLDDHAINAIADALASAVPFEEEETEPTDQGN